MKFNFTEEQNQFQEALERWLMKNYSFEQRKTVVDNDPGCSSDHWAALAELGTFALTAPEEADGFGGNGVDALLIMQQMGRHLVVEPVTDLLIATDLLKTADTDPLILKNIAAGSVRIACAFHERASRYDPAHVATRAERTATGYVLNGEKTIVMHGETADYFIVSARTRGTATDTDGIVLFLLPRTSPGLALQGYRTVDGARAADLTLNHVEVSHTSLLQPESTGWNSLERAIDVGTTAVCAEALGVLQILNQSTLEHLKTRAQFGVVLGSFQALQHRCVEMRMAYEQARSLTMLAAVKLSSTDPIERKRAVSAAKIQINKALRFVGQNAVHLHGGIGVTHELPLSHYFKRSTVISKTFGDLDHHIERFVALPTFVPAH